MAALEEVSLKYVHDNINEIIKVPIDMSCINKPLMMRLARLFTLEDLAKVNDPKDKIMSRIYLHKVSSLLTPTSPTSTPSPPQSASRSKLTAQQTPPQESTATPLRACTLCNQVYARSQEPYLVCPKAQVEIGFGGEVLQRHE
ncbi:hypothetical protein HK097_007421, partial [Rhizophlyctis rosea]